MQVPICFHLYILPSFCQLHQTGGNRFQINAVFRLYQMIDQHRGKCESDIFLLLRIKKYFQRFIHNQAKMLKSYY